MDGVSTFTLAIAAVCTLIEAGGVGGDLGGVGHAVEEGVEFKAMEGGEGRGEVANFVGDVFATGTEEGKIFGEAT